jgi:hypothetical protein
VLVRDDDDEQEQNTIARRKLQPAAVLLFAVAARNAKNRLFIPSKQTYSWGFATNMEWLTMGAI